MNLKKKFKILLISIWGVGVILVLVFVSVLALRRNLTISKVQASPSSTCRVGDDLEVEGSYKLFVGCQLVEGGCLDGGTTKKCSANARDCTCNAADDWASVDCPSDTYVISGGCDSLGWIDNINKNLPLDSDTWHCNWGADTSWERARALCCRINVNWDPSLRPVDIE